MKKNTVKLIAIPYFSILFLVSFVLFTALKSEAATINVSSISDLKTALKNSRSGDVIVLADGTYFDTTLDIDKSNITLKSATPGGVFLNGTNDININGNFIVFSGFQFTSGDIGSNIVIEVYGNNNLLTQLNFSGYFAKKYIEIKAGTRYNQISYSNIEKKPAAAIIGCTIQISTSPTVPGYHKIRYCSFKDFYGLGGDYGNEPIRIGLSTENSNKSRAVVEYCYFNNTGLGDSESISIKCQENVIRFCTFTNQQNAMLVFRNGDNNVAYSNFFINAGGIRVKEANNVFCYNNYFENSGVGSSADAVTFIYDTTTYPVVLNNINFIHNTFYNCGTIDLGGTGATNNTWANNIFFKTSGTIFLNPNTGTTWLGNIRQGSLGISIPTGITNSNPLLVTNADGYKVLSASSPAIDASSPGYPAILDITDIDDDPNILFTISGKLRPTSISLKDVGCDEFTTDVTTNHPLDVTEVGPSYMDHSSLSLYNHQSSILDPIKIFPNQTHTSISVDASSLDENLVEIAIFNLNGQKVFFEKINKSLLANKQPYQFDVSNLNKGIYFVSVVSETTSKTIKMILNK
jgi:hypothetical protein